MPRITRQFEIIVEYFEAEGDEPAVFVASNEELGLVCEAETPEDLAKKVLPLACELFELNILPRLHGEERDMPPAFMLNSLAGSFGGQILP
jgi:hypothetical protein